MASNSHLYREPLDETHIRLLDLKAGHDHDDIEVEIRISKLSNGPQYEALSYEWGSAKRFDCVNIGNKKISITRGLHFVLQQIRLKSQPRTLWIDAISINQNDTSEKNQQVPLMAEIFGRATRVLIWLGPQILRSRDVFQMLSVLAKLWVSREVRNQRDGELRPLSWAEVDPVEALVLDSWDCTLWDAIYELVNRSYFRRTWIVQEIAVANDPRVLCGSLEISWAHFSYAAAYLGRSLYHLHQNPSDAGVARISAITCLRSVYQMARTIELADVCIVSQSLQATNQRDKVYGFLGLLYGRARYPTVDGLLRVDYDLPVHAVYLQAAQCSILERQDLRICHSQAFLSERPVGLSSWAPDWSPNLDLTHTIAVRLHNKVQGAIKGKISFESDIMRLNGYLIDRISCVSAPLTSEDPLLDIQTILVFLSRDKAGTQLPEDEIMTAQGLEKVIERLKRKIYRGSETEYEAVWRTLIADTALFTTAPPSFRQHFDAVVDSLRLRARGIFWQCIKVCDGTKMDRSSWLRLRQDAEARRLCGRIISQDPGPYYRELVNTVGRRVFFATDKGYIGFGSPGAKVGDSIAILKGGWTPFILRQHGEISQMVGDSYVHGIRGARSWRRIGSKRQSFRIR